MSSRAMRVVAWLLALVVIAACDGSRDAPDADVDAAASALETIGPAARPARLFTPPAHDGRTPLPLVLVLHGYGVDATLQDLYFGATRAARSGGFYVLLPDGTADGEGNRHWDVRGVAIDDHAYLRALLEEAAARVPVAAGEVFVLGHSNGGFMAYRLACSSPDLVAGIASLAGAEVEPPCTPARPVSVLQIHGTADTTVTLDGGSIQGLAYGPARATVERWAAAAGCDTSAPDALAPIDLVTSVDGAETTVTSFRAGCEGATAELWTMEGGDHIPALAPGLTTRIVDWLRAHAR